MTRQTSSQVTEATNAQIEYLKAKGFGTFTNIQRIAIDRMAREEGHTTMTTKNLYYAWASNSSGASLDVNSGGKTNSIRELENAARRELSSGWQVHIMQVHIDGDGQSTMGVTEVKTFTIR